MAKTSTKESAGSLEGFDIALKVISSVCGAVPTFLLSKHNKGGCIVAAALDGSEAAFRVPVEVNGLDEPIEIPTSHFASALKGRKTGSITVKGTSLHIESGSYKAQVNTNEAKEMPTISAPEGEGVQHFVLTPELHQFLSVKLPQVRIERVHSALPDVMLNFRASEKSWYLATYDAQQMCYVTSKPGGNIGKFQILLPYTRFSTFVRDLPVANCKVYVNENVLVAITPQFRLCIALPHFEEGTFVDPDVAFEHAKRLKGVSGNPFSISASQLTAFLENSRELLAIGTEVTFSPSKTGTKISVVSAAGETHMTVKGSVVSSKFGLDYRFVQTLLQKQPKKDGACTS